LKIFRVAAMLVSLTILATTHAHAQQEFPPPQGKGRVVVVLSGQLGAAHATFVTQQIVQLGQK
jgi:hypothetical protein